jgi:hypothetical protein
MGDIEDSPSVKALQKEIKQLEGTLRITDFAPRGGIPLAVVLVAVGITSPFACIYYALHIGTPPYFGTQNMLSKSSSFV